MNMTTSVGAVPSPTHPANELLAHESECRSALKPLLDGLIDMVESAGWSRRTAASTLMFLAAQHVSASSGTSGSGRSSGAGAKATKGAASHERYPL